MLENLSMKYWKEQLSNSFYSLVTLWRVCKSSNLRLFNVLKKQQIHKTSNICLLGNGTSLKDESFVLTKDVSYLVVNRHVLSDDYVRSKPNFYVLADPHFFNHSEGLFILKEINIKTNWPLYLFVVNSKSNMKIANNIFKHSSFIKIIYYSNIEVRGCEIIKRYLYNHNLGMPRPQNVMVAALYISICLGFKYIELFGVEHSWTKYLSVNSNNEVCLYNPHFYDTKKNEEKTWKDIHHEDATMGDVLRMYAYMFDSYHEIRKIANRQQVAILNRTKNSFIDAFERQ